MIGGLPRRDFWLLPLISIFTVLGMLGGAEVLARVGWPEQLVNGCQVQDQALVFRFQPNCSSTMKAFEGPWYTNNYNACGYRSAAPCGPVSAGTRRIALIGSSVSEGYLVEYPNTIGARLGDDLTAMCGGPVEVQNLASGYGARQDHRLVLRMEEALTLRPSAVLLIQVPFDVEAMLLEDATEPTTGAASNARPAANTQSSVNQVAELRKRVSDWFRNSRAVVVAQHFLFRDWSAYLPLYLNYYGDKADFLRPPFTAAWQERLRRFDLLITKLADRARQEGVPFMLAFVPHQAEVALMSGRSAPPGVDPQALPNAIAAIAARHGVTFVETSPVLRREPKLEEFYYRSDGHPSGRGLPIVARYIAERYVSVANGPFTDCRSIATMP
jgi:hypothetical protein